MKRKKRASGGTKASLTKAVDVRSGNGNRYWGRYDVTLSRPQRFRPDEYVKVAPISLSTAPGEHNGAGINLEIGQGGHLSPFNFQLKVHSAPKGWKVLDQCVTLDQLYALEEAFRAVFRAAREEGILTEDGDQSWTTREGSRQKQSA